MSTLEIRLFSFESEERFRDIAKNGILNSTSPTVITWVCDVGDNHSFGAALSVVPFRSQDFPDNIFHGCKLQFEPCCKAIQADAENRTRDWAQHVAGQLRHISHCDFKTMQLQSDHEYWQLTPCPLHDGLGRWRSSAAPPSDATAQYSMPNTSGEHEKLSPPRQQKRAASDDVLPRQGQRKRLLEAPLIETPLVKDVSTSIENVACYFVQKIISGGSLISTAKSAEQEFSESPSLYGDDEYTIYHLFKSQAAGQKRVSMIWWTMATFVSLMVKGRRNQGVNSSELLRMRKWGTVIVEILNRLAEKWDWRALRVWICLCYAEPGVRKTALDDILIDNLSTVAERIFTLLANDDWMKNVLQPDKHEHFPNFPNPVKIISDYSKKGHSEIAKRLNLHQSLYPRKEAGPAQCITSPETPPCTDELFYWLSFCMGGREVPLRLTLVLIRQARIRWDVEGCEQHVPFPNNGQIQHLMPLLKITDSQLTNTMCDWATRSETARKFQEASREPLYSLSPDQMCRLEDANPDVKTHWRRSTLLVVSCLFPVDQAIDPNFSSHGNTLAPVFRHLLSNSSNQDLGSVPCDELAEALVALSKFGTAAERFHAIAKAESLPQVCDHLLVAIATRKSILLRLEGNILESLAHIQSAMARDSFPYYDNSTKVLDTIFGREHSQTKRHYAECGSLLTSLVECHLQLGEFKNAEDRVFMWPAPVDSPIQPLLEVYFLRSKTMVVARMYRWKGDFESASENLDLCLSFMDELNSNRPQVLAQKAGVLCELKEAPKAEAVLRGDLDRWKANRPCSKGLRRLQVSYLETMVILNRYAEAEAVLAPLLEYHRGDRNPDTVNDVLMVRIWIYRALMRHLQSLESTTSPDDWRDVQDTWNEARDKIKSSRVFGSPGFTHRFVELWILDAERKQAVSCGVALPKDAIESTRNLRREHHITGLGTFWLDKIVGLLAAPA